MAIGSKTTTSNPIKKEVSEANPANAVPKRPAGYRPMSSTRLRLEAPERPGYHRRWFRGDPARIQQALQAGYQFVDAETAGMVNNFDLAGDQSKGGSTDMGSRVSVLSGSTGSDGQAGRMYLMECPEEFHEESRDYVRERVDNVAAALSQGGMPSQGETQSDRSKRYNRSKAPDLFTKRRP